MASDQTSRRPRRRPTWWERWPLWRRLPALVVLSGVVFGLIDYAFDRGLAHAVLKGALFGVLFTALTVIGERWGRRRRGGGQGRDAT